MYVPEAIAVAAAIHPELLVTERWPCDVETEGVLTLGATVIDRRRHSQERGNMDVAVKLDARGAVDFIRAGLQRAR